MSVQRAQQQKVYTLVERVFNSKGVKRTKLCPNLKFLDVSVGISFHLAQHTCVQKFSPQKGVGEPKKVKIFGFLQVILQERSLLATLEP